MVVPCLLLATLALTVYAGSALVATGAPGSLANVDAEQILVTVILGVWVIGFLYASLREWKSRPVAASWLEFPSDVLNFFAVFVGAVLAYWLSIEMALGAVVASALLGLSAATLFKPQAVPAFAGSFVGMASPELFAYPGIVLAGAIAGLVFIAGKRVFNGYGGKLGTTAWAGCLIAVAILGRPMLSAPVPTWDLGWLLVLYSVVGAVLTFVLNVRFALGPVMASSLVGLAAGLLLPSLYGAGLGGTLAAMVFCASFAGMSSTDRIQRAYWMIPAGVVCAVAFMYSAPFLGGAGGKLGTIAFGSVIGLHGLIAIAEKAQRRYRKLGSGP